MLGFGKKQHQSQADAMAELQKAAQQEEEDEEEEEEVIMMDADEEEDEDEDAIFTATTTTAAEDLQHSENGEKEEETETDELLSVKPTQNGHTLSQADCSAAKLQKPKPKPKTKSKSKPKPKSIQKKKKEKDSKKKKKRFKQATIALREIKRYQKTSDSITPRAVMNRTLRSHIAQHCAEDQEGDVKLAAGVVECVREIVEHELVHLTDTSVLIAANADRITLNATDAGLYQHIHYKQHPL